MKAIRVVVLVAGLSLLGCESPVARGSGYPAEIAGMPDTPGFPLQVAGYARGRMYMYEPGMKNLSIAYDRADSAVVNAVTIYFYPGTTSLDAQFELEKQQVSAVHPDAVLLDERTEEFDSKGVKHSARVAQFRLNGVFARQRQELHSELILVKFSARYTKVRSTAPFAQAATAQTQVRKLMEGVNWAH
jgi:hypothetical protein